MIMRLAGGWGQGRRRAAGFLRGVENNGEFERLDSVAHGDRRAQRLDRGGPVYVFVAWSLSCRQWRATGGG